MAVVSCNEKQELSGARYTLTGKEYTRGYVVILDDPADGASIAIQASSLPDRLDEHPDDSDAKCVDLGLAMHETRLIWHVYATYRTSTRDTPALDPLDDPVQIDWGSWVYTEALSEDKDGEAILNSATDPFDPPLEQDVHDLMVTISRNESNYSPISASTYYDKVNSDSTTIAGLPISARQAKLIAFTGRSAERNAIEYWVVTYQIMFRVATWDRKVLDHGLRKLSATNLSHILEEDISATGGKAEITSPVRLNGSGAVLARDAASVFETFETHELIAFAPLGLNITE